MHDDLGGRRAAGSALRPNPPAAPPPTPPVASEPAAAPAGRTLAGPLPPRAATPDTAGGRLPRRRSLIGRLILLLVILLILAGAGLGLAWAYQAGFITLPLLFGRSAPTPAPTPTVAAATDLIPATASFIIQYQFPTIDARSQIATAWQAAPAPSLTSLLQGDPRALLENTENTEAYYVVLPEDSRPYLLVPATDATRQLLQNTPDAQTAELDGWLISHSVSTNLYVEALGGGTLNPEATNALTPPATDTAPIRLLAGPALLQQLRRHLAGTPWSNAPLQEAVLTGRFATNTAAVLLLEGTGRTIQQAAATAAADPNLTTLLPADLTALQLGADFASDLASWQATNDAIDQEILAAPAIQALLQELNTPYAFASFARDTGTYDYLLVIELPPSPATPLTLDDAGLKDALTGMVPLLTGRPAAATVAFNPGEYAGIPLRFANITSTAAIDYALTDTHLLIATSKDAMFSLLDTIAGTAPSMALTLPYQTLATYLGTQDPSQLTVATVTLPQLLALLPPGAEQHAALTIGLTTTSTTATDQVRLNGAVLLTSAAAPAPAASPAPAPSQTIPAADLQQSIAQNLGTPLAELDLNVAASSNLAITNSGFSPQTTVVTTGTTVTWTNQDSTTHTVTGDGTVSQIDAQGQIVTLQALPADRFNSGTIAPGATFSHTFNNPGAYTYHSASQNNLAGAVIVLEASAATPQ